MFIYPFSRFNSPLLQDTTSILPVEVDADIAFGDIVVKFELIKVDVLVSDMSQNGSMSRTWNVHTQVGPAMSEEEYHRYRMKNGHAQRHRIRRELVLEAFVGHLFEGWS